MNKPQWWRSILDRRGGESKDGSVDATAEPSTARDSAGQQPPGHPPPLLEDGPVSWVNAIAVATDKAMALQWLARLAGDEWLVDVAVRARFAEVRLAAAQRLEASAALGQVAQASRGKDKGVYRHCSDVLNAREAEAREQARASELLQALSVLETSDPVSAPRLQELEKEFQALSSGGPAIEQCGQRIEELRKRLQEQSRLLQLLHACLREAGSLEAEVNSATSCSEELLNEWQARHSALTNKSWPTWLHGHADLKALTRTAHDVGSTLEAMAQDLELLRACESFMQALTAADCTTAEAAQLAGGWESLAKPKHAKLLAELESRWMACQPSPAVAPAPEKAPKPKPRRVDLPGLSTMIGEMEQALEQGTLVIAIGVEEKLAGFAAELPSDLTRRFSLARARLAELQGWARWGTDQARQELAAKAQELGQGSADVSALEEAIPALRAQWKALDSHGPATRAQWLRFNECLEKAYAPVALHRAELKAREAAAHAIKAQLHADAETWLDGVDWEHVDFKAIPAKRQQVIEQWQRALPAGFRSERLLRKRFDAWLARIDEKIASAKSAEINRCETLIGEAQALTDVPNLRAATDRAKALQQSWREQAGTVVLPRSERDKLWQRFRAACDTVFARRDSEKAEHAARQAALDENTQSAIGELEASLAGNDSAAISQAVAKLRSLLPDPAHATKRGDSQVHRSARDALKKAQAHLDFLQREKRRAPYALMQQKAAIIERLELAAANGEPLEDLVVQTQAAWQALPTLPEKFEQALATRRARASSATSVNLAEGREIRNAVLLDLEITLDLASPDIFDAERRARRLEMLQSRFRESSLVIDHDALILKCHATAALPDAVEPQRMEAILRALASR